jgi:hypothetical protein
MFSGHGSSPAHFQRQLELTIRLAQINEQVNPAS